MKYRRIALTERWQIYVLLKTGMSKEAIASELGFHRSSIFRELARNRVGNGAYYGAAAHQLYMKRLRSCRNKKKIQGSLEATVVSLLMEDFSPEQISGRLRLERSKNYVCHQSIYSFVKRHPILVPMLRRFNKRGAGRLRQRRSKDEGKRCISLRPKHIERRKRIGDWERDGLYGANRKQLLACVDRKSRYLRIGRPQIWNSKNISHLTLELIKKVNPKIHTITNDRGTEFEDGKNMNTLVYYCKPMRPDQRGTIENTIGLLRQYVKRDTDLEKLGEKELSQIEDKLNNRPRKCLGYRTPHEIMFNKFVALGS